MSFIDRAARVAAACLVLPSLALAVPQLGGGPGEEESLGEELILERDDGHSFAGTWVVPEGRGPFPTALLVSPAGDHGRDELRSGGEHWTHLAETLRGVGIASLRVDNRGVGGSVSDARPAWTNDWTTEDLARDLRGHLDWLRVRPEVDRHRLGLVAHGDSCLTAARVASGDRGLAYVVLLAPTGRSGVENLLGKQMPMLPADVEDRDAIEVGLRGALETLGREGRTDAVIEGIGRFLAPLGFGEEGGREEAAAFAATFDNPLYREWLRTDPARVVAGIESPLRIVAGEEDSKFDPVANTEALRAALRTANAHNSEVRLVEGLDHFLEAAGELHLDDAIEGEIVDWVADACGLSRKEEWPRLEGVEGPHWIRGATIVDVESGTHMGPVDLRIVQGRVSLIEPARDAEPGEGEFDGRGAFIVPGLWDSHVHLSFAGGEALGLLVASGVTSVRDLGGDWDQLRGWRSEISIGSLVGPRVFAAGPFLDGPKPNDAWRLFAVTGEEGEAGVREIAGLGVDFIKVHSRLPREAWLAAMATAKELEVPILGHVPAGISPLEAIELGYSSLEHADSLFKGLQYSGLPEAGTWGGAYRYWCSEEGVASMERLAESGSQLTPTLVTYEALLPRVDPMFGQLRPWFSDVTLRLHRAGVPLLAGTDLARDSNGMKPGASLHRELELMVEAGLTPAEALRTANLNPAHGMGRADLGVVRVGAVADLLLVEEDPLANIQALRRIRGLFLDGRWFGRAELERIRSRARASSNLIAD